MSSTTFFKESANEWDNGRPIGFSPTGIVFFRLPGASDDLTEIPFSEIERVEVVPESRYWRIAWSTTRIVTGILLGAISLGAFSGLLSGEVRGGPMIWIFSLCWPFSFIAALMGVCQWFSKLGCYLVVHTRQHSGKFYLEPTRWVELRQTLKDSLAQGGLSTQFPDLP